jgi:hypothetical protein
VAGTQRSRGCCGAGTKSGRGESAALRSGVLERIDDLLARKPHLASRKSVGEIGQGATPSAGTVDLAAMLRQRAR